jgi:hypothetical protein
MARVYRPRRKTLQAVAAHAAHALAAIGGHAVAPEAGDRTSLHESLPVWLVTAKDLDRLRTEHATAKPDIRKYMRDTGRWVHLLYRGGKPFGYVHGERRPGKPQSHQCFDDRRGGSHPTGDRCDRSRCAKRDCAGGNLRVPEGGTCRCGGIAEQARRGAADLHLP